ncbi:MAG: ArdC family protein [Acidiferrobacteraceae bacterium]
MNTNDRNQTPTSTTKVEGAQASASAGGDIHQQITNTIITAMETAQGTGKRLWDAQPSLPLNLITGKPYSGINVLILWSAGLRNGYTSPYWLTYKQAADIGGQVRQDEHGTRCVFYKPWESTDTNKDTGETETVKGAVLKSFTAFNLDQIDGIEAPAKEARPAFAAIEDAERILSASQAQIHMGGTQAFYRRADDTIHLPNRERFTSTEAFYSVALHEMTHSTGHSSRLDRTFGERFGDDAYAMEELVAEMGSAFLTAELGILGATLEHHADYLSSWLRVLKQDKRAILTAAAQAAKAQAFIKSLNNPAEQDAA